MSKVLIEVSEGAVKEVYGTEVGEAFVKNLDEQKTVRMVIKADPQLVTDAERDCVFTSSDVEAAQEAEATEAAA